MKHFTIKLDTIYYNRAQNLQGLHKMTREVYSTYFLKLNTGRKEHTVFTVNILAAFYTIHQYQYVHDFKNIVY